MNKLKRKIFNFLSLIATTLLATIGFANPVLDPAKPVLNAQISQTQTTTTVQQTSQQAIINWKSFNIGEGETTHFIQPNTQAIALNRIDPNQGVSQIYGSLSANGKIILINAAGIHFGPTAMVDVGSIIASTTDISDTNFLKGNYVFDKQYGAAIHNEGTIIAANHGLIALVGANIQNNGAIIAKQGNILLGTGNKFTFDFYGDQLINFTLANTTKTAGTIKNSGSLLADGGKILVSAHAAQNVIDNAIYMGGVAQANSVHSAKGEIILDGGKGKVQITGKISAQGKQNNKGGKIVALGDNLNLASSAVLDVSGNLGGGELLIGGDYQGKGVIPNARTTFVASGAQLNADAYQNGNGGKIIVWSDNHTEFHGNASAKGGSEGGDGGLVETSGHYLDVRNASINLLSAKGKTGNWLLDPINVIICNAGSTPNCSADANATYSSSTYQPTNDASSPSLIFVSNLQNNLATANVIITTTPHTGTGTDLGNITIAAPISWSGSTSLTLSAANDIAINGQITMNTAGSALVLNAAHNVTQTALITGSGGLMLNSGGTTTLNLLNTYTGKTIISSGTVIVNTLANRGTSSSLGRGTLDPIIDLGAATLRYDGTGNSSARVINLTDTATLDASGSGALTLRGGVTGAAKNLTLTGTGAATESGAINTTTGSVTKSGTGIWELSSNGSSYSGGTVINNGTLSIPRMKNTGSNSPIGTQGLTLTSGGIFSYTGGNASTNRAISVDVGTLQILSNASARTLTLTGNITNNGTLTFDTNTSGTVAGNIALTTTGINGGGNVIKTGSGTLTYGVENSYSGTTQVNEGTLALSNAGGLNGTVGIFIGTNANSQATLSLGFKGALGNTFAPITLFGNGVENNGVIIATASTPSLNMGNTITLGSNISLGGIGNFIINGEINDETNSFSLTKTNTGTVTLAGNNHYKGGTVINAGTLNVSHAGGLGSVGTIVLNGDASTLSLNTSTLLNTNQITLNTSGTSGLTSALTTTLANNIFLTGAVATLTANTGTIFTLSGGSIFTNSNSNLNFASTGSTLVSENISLGTGALTKSGNGTLTLNNANNFSGGTTVSTGTLAITHGQALGSGALTLAGTSAFSSAGNNAVTNDIAISGIGAHTITSSSGALDMLGGVNLGAGPGIITFTGAGNFNLSGVLSGAAPLTKSGVGTLVLSNNNTAFTGNTNITGGVLRLTNANALGSSDITTPGTITVNAATLSLDLGGNELANKRALTFTGASANLLDDIASGTDTISNPIIFSAGATPIFTAYNAGAILAINSNITNNTATLTVNGTGNTIINGTLGSGAGGLKKSGTGTLFLNAANSYTGTTTLSAGNLSVGNNAALGLGTLLFSGGTLQGNTSITLANPFTVTSLNGTIGGSNDIQFTNAGTFNSLSTLEVNNTGTTTFAALNGSAANRGTLLGGVSAGNIYFTENVGTTSLSAINILSHLIINPGLTITTRNNQSYENIQLAGTSGTTTLATTTGDVILNGNVSWNSNSAVTFNVNSASDIILAGNINSGNYGSINLVAGANISQLSGSIITHFLSLMNARGTSNLTSSNNKISQLGNVTAATLNIGNSIAMDQRVGTSILANNLSLNVTSAVDFSAGANNRINTIAANVTGTLSVLNNPVANTTLSIGTVNAINGVTASGNIVMANNNGGITLNQSVTATAGKINLTANGRVILNPGTQVNSNATGVAINISANRFTNNAGATALNPSNGNYLIWSKNPNPFNGSTPDKSGGLLYQFKQYNASYEETSVLGAGNGFLYTLAPMITPTLINVTKIYDGNTNAYLTNNNFLLAGVVGGDSVEINNILGKYDTVNAGLNKTVNVSGISIASAKNGYASVYGYQLSSSSASTNDASITPFNPPPLDPPAVNPKMPGAIIGVITGANNQYDAGFAVGNTAIDISGNTNSPDMSGIAVEKYATWNRGVLILSSSPSQGSNFALQAEHSPSTHSSLQAHKKTYPFNGHRLLAESIPRDGSNKNGDDKNMDELMSLFDDFPAILGTMTQKKI